MATISLCMIVKDEEDVLARCLDSVAGAVDEIIIVDTGSGDSTMQIARQYTDKVYTYTWQDDFAAARNFAFAQATKDYQMWLDADDVLEPNDRDALCAIKPSLTADVVMCKYHTAFDENGDPTFSYYRERLLRRACGFRWAGAVHEAIAPSGDVQYVDIAVTHKKERQRDSGRNLRIYEKQLAAGVILEPRHQFYYARELYYHAQYEKAAAVLEKFLEDGRGWVENSIDACHVLSDCYKSLARPDLALRALLRSMEYDAPRAELCCDIGGHFMDAGQYRTAIFWYQLAASRPRSDQSGGFVQAACYGYIPYLQLCVCYDRLGEQDRAREYNELAGTCRPGDPTVEANRAYFAAAGGHH